MSRSRSISPDPRTEPVTLDHWRAGVHKGRPSLAHTYQHPGRIGGAAFEMLWTDVTLERDEPATHTTRLTTTTTWCRESMPRTGQQLIAKTVAVALHAAGGFRAVWTEIMRTRADTAATDRRADAAILTRRAVALEDHATITDMFAAGLLVAVPIRTEPRDRPPRLTDHHHERSTATVPAAHRLRDDNGQQCGWIVEDGRCFALDPSAAP